MASRDSYQQRFDEDVQQNEHNTCPECEGRVTTNTRETVCDDCGLVLAEQQIDHGPEWRSFDDDGEQKERTGAPLTAARHDRGLSTEIGRTYDGNGKRLTDSKRRQLGRLRREHSRAQFETKRERNQTAAIVEIRRMTGALGMSDSVRDRACRRFRTAQAEDLIRGRSIEAMAAASLYAACRCTGLPRTIGEVTAVAAVPQGKVENAYRVLNRELELPAEPVTPDQYVPRFASALELSQTVQRRAQTLAEVATGEGLVNGVNPVGMAGGCLLVAATEHGVQVTQQAVADVTSVSSVTLRERRDELLSVVQ